MIEPLSSIGTSRQLKAGDLIHDRYRIRGLMGEGASGSVYDAERVGTDSGSEPVALKIIHRHLIRDRQVSRRFAREASILSKLRCPYLVPLLEFGETQDGVLFMALERAQGPTLDRLIADGALTLDSSVAIARQICAALEVAHAAGIVHRDLKPGNVIVERTPDRQPRARVLDFGMAKVLHGDAGISLSTLTEQNMVFGTPEYMAPEQARGEDVDERCDIYALGIVLYEMLTGQVPFQAGTPIATMTAHLTQTVVPPSRVAPEREIPPAVEAVVLNALQKDRKQRYASASAFSEALTQAGREPTNVASVAPRATAGEADLETRDTETDLQATGGGPSPISDALPSRLWIVAAFVAALLGLVLGLIMSLVGS